MLQILLQVVDFCLKKTVNYLSNVNLAFKFRDPPLQKFNFFSLVIDAFLLLFQKALAAIQLCLLVTAEEGIDEFGDNVELLVLSCFVLGVCWICF